MLSWGQAQLKSDKELQQVQMYVITQPAGLIGRLVGRNLRFRVERFTYHVSSRQQQREMSNLRQVEVEADSLVPECEVRKSPAPLESSPKTSSAPALVSLQGAEKKKLNADITRWRFEERVPLTISEASKLMRRTRGYVLDVTRYPYIQFDVEAEDTTTIQGTLHLHGDSHPLACSKKVEGTELVVRCPVSLHQYGITPFKLWLGLLSVADTVLVETRVPVNALRL